MFQAIWEGVVRIEAFPGGRAACPMCGADVVAKCGKITAWHWAHVSLEDCDPWAEPDTHWHHEWQGLWPSGAREIVMSHDGEKHRADIVTSAGVIVEVQHSSIGVDDIHAREAFYQRFGNMVWIFDATRAYAEERLDIRDRSGNGERYRTFRWKHPRKSIASCRKPVILDLGNGFMLRVKKIHTEAPCGGWGYLFSADETRTILESGRL